LPDEPWFHVPNQFWQHKNHKLILEALALLYKSGNAPLVLATGKEEDPRNPDYVLELKTRLDEEGLRERFRLLGQIPYIDMMGLMLHAVAVINPSRFEGWSTTVEEAKAFGKKILLSDIAVHREQNPSRGLFFDVVNEQKLSDLMLESIACYDMKEERKISCGAFSSKEVAMKEFAMSYTMLISSLKKVS